MNQQNHDRPPARPPGYHNPLSDQMDSPQKSAFATAVQV